MLLFIICSQKRSSSSVTVMCLLCEREVSLRETSAPADLFHLFLSLQAVESLFCARLLYTFPQQFMILGETVAAY